MGELLYGKKGPAAGSAESAVKAAAKGVQATGEQDLMELLYGKKGSGVPIHNEMSSRMHSETRAISHRFYVLSSTRPPRAALHTLFSPTSPLHFHTIPSRYFNRHSTFVSRFHPSPLHLSFEK